MVTSSNQTDWKTKLFDIGAGVAVFVGVTMLLSDYSPELALGLLGTAVAYLLLTHTSDVQKLVGQYSSALHPNASG